VSEMLERRERCGWDSPVRANDEGRDGIRRCAV
jgi:hypothetical protein